MKNTKKTSLLTGAILAGALIATQDVTAANLIQFEDLGTGSELRTRLLSNNNVVELLTSAEDGLKSIEASCGGKKTDAKSKDAKCGEGKCGEGKCGEKKADAVIKDKKCCENKSARKSEKAKCCAKKADKKADSKSKDAKCGEGKCGGK